MPEGPELHIASRFVNKVCQGVTFSGKVLKSEVSTKNPDVDWDEKAYTITSSARGKEVKLHLTASLAEKSKSKKKQDPSEQMAIVFRFGMSGKFEFVPIESKAKHAHLNFYTSDGSQVLSFVDYRRFGKWEVNGDWGPDRGPCILTEYSAFRRKVLQNLSSSVFNKAICEALLDQKYFNGVGNYLRAEVLYRLRIPPFTQARSVLEPLAEAELPDEKEIDGAGCLQNGDHEVDLAKVKTEPGIKDEKSDILQLCNQLANEVISLNVGEGYVYKSGNQAQPEEDDSYSAFSSWLQCYYKPGMTNLVDRNGRTIWFKGPAGPMAPTNKKTRGVVKRARLIETSKKTDAGVAKSKVRKVDEVEDDIKKIPAKRKKKDDTAKPNGAINSSKQRKTKAPAKARAPSKQGRKQTAEVRKSTVQACDGAATEHVGLRRSARTKRS